MLGIVVCIFGSSPLQRAVDSFNGPNCYRQLFAQLQRLLTEERLHDDSIRRRWFYEPAAMIVEEECMHPI